MIIKKVTNPVLKGVNTRYESARNAGILEMLLSILGGILVIGLVASFFWGIIWCIVSIFMLGWNVLVHEVFKGPAITFWQAFWVYIFLSTVGGFFKASSSSSSSK